MRSGPSKNCLLSGGGCAGSVSGAGEITFDDQVGESRPLAGLHALTTGDVVFGAAAGTAQRIRANTLELGGDLDEIPTVATVYRDQAGDLHLDTNTLNMGVNQKLTVIGSLDIDNNGGNASTITVGDLNALGNINVRGAEINIRTRGPGQVMEPNGFFLEDQGVDLVAGGHVSFSTPAVVSGSGSTPRVAESDGVVPGANNLIVETRDFPISGADLVGAGSQILDLRSQGPSSTHTVGVVNGADSGL